jgi:replication-associated recombination protein RarA
MSASFRSISTLLHPGRLEDHTLPSKEINRLNAMVADASIKNLLFYGGNGRGKTLVARLISQSVVPQNGIELNGASSQDRGFIVSGELTSYGSSTPLFGDRKLCFVDNADFLPKQAQGDLLATIDKCSTASFILAANKPTQLLPGLQSRLLPICFDLSPEDLPEVQKRFTERCAAVLSDAGILYDTTQLTEVVIKGFPDLWKVVNALFLRRMWRDPLIPDHELSPIK